MIINGNRWEFRGMEMKTELYYKFTSTLKICVLCTYEFSFCKCSSICVYVFTLWNRPWDSRLKRFNKTVYKTSTIIISTICSEVLNYYQHVVINFGFIDAHMWKYFNNRYTLRISKNTFFPVILTYTYSQIIVFMPNFCLHLNYY